MSQTQATETVDKDEINARNFLISKPFKSLQGKGYTPDSIEIRRERDYYESLLKQNDMSLMTKGRLKLESFIAAEVRELEQLLE